ncbi:MAG: hypothetical protein KAS32_17820 [Candidatus Peribacteraceae bacterium]|nr:hypothetical protein [Candidatus Peribacteraceae bacterium]
MTKDLLTIEVKTITTQCENESESCHVCEDLIRMEEVGVHTYYGGVLTNTVRLCSSCGEAWKIHEEKTI